jgi:hypothetical protein
VPEQPTVRVGQVWEDTDKRHPGRRVQVVRLETVHLRVWSGTEMRYVTEDIPVAVCRRAGAPVLSRETRIRVDRFRPTSTGYRLVEDVLTEAAR